MTSLAEAVLPAPMFSTEPLWLILCALYFLTSIYYETVHGDTLSNWTTFAFFAIGAAILVVLNRRYWIESEAALFVAELGIIVFLFAAWYAGWTAIRIYLRAADEYGPFTFDDEEVDGE